MSGPGRAGEVCCRLCETPHIPRLPGLLCAAVDDEDISRRRLGYARSFEGRREGRRVLDIALGVLVALRRCGADAAFEELITAAGRNDIPVFAMASALVALASADPSARLDSAARRAAEREWAQLLAPDISGG